MLVEAENLNFVYQPGTEFQTYALKNLTFSVPKKKLIGLVGDEGSGKSTLLHLLSGILLPSSGILKYKGDNLAVKNEEQRSKLRLEELGIISPTAGVLSHLNVMDNIMLGLPKKTDSSEEQVFELLEKLNIKKIADQKAAELSRAEKQKVKIARGLINDPELVLIDQPAVLDQVLAVSKQAALIAASRNFSTVEEADMIINLHAGEIKSINN